MGDQFQPLLLVEQRSFFWRVIHANPQWWEGANFAVPAGIAARGKGYRFRLLFGAIDDKRCREGVFRGWSRLDQVCERSLDANG